MYCKRFGYTPDYLFFLRQILRAGNNEAAAKFAQMLVSEGSSGPLVSVEQIVDCFTEVNAVQPCTQFLLETLKDDKPEDGPLQTKLLEMNLNGNNIQVVSFL